MTTVAEWYKIDGAQIAQSIDEIREKLSSTDGEAVLDFSSVERLDTAGLSALEGLATAADEKGVRLELRGVNVGVYKVLKLARLTSRFSYH